MNSGIYHLLIYLPKGVTITIGKLGSFNFPSGYYIYTGSALKGMEARILRHLRQEKRLRWHIDYLLQYGRIVEVVTHQTKKHLECYYNKRILSLPGCNVLVEGFGSSDCKCPAHLAYFENKPFGFKLP